MVQCIDSGSKLMTQCNDNHDSFLWTTQKWEVGDGFRVCITGKTSWP